jgi:hypothetical protein
MGEVIGLFKCKICGKRIDENWICQDCLLAACKYASSSWFCDYELEPKRRNRNVEGD